MNEMRKSAALYSAACQLAPGGVHSPVRSFKQLHEHPRFITHGKGAYLFDADNNRYIDYIGAYGPAILGHGAPEITQAIHDAAAQGLGFGTPTPRSNILAERIKSHLPHMQKIRFVNSGTEATMSAIRLARGFTGRNKVIKCIGCYHGHSDSLLVKAGSGALTHGAPDSAGVPLSLISDTLLAQYNDIAAIKALFSHYKDEIAAIIIEPIAGNMGMVLPKPGFLKSLRELCHESKTLLIFDEVMTGFRVAAGGAQEIYQVEADLTCLGKIIGGGLPVGAFGGQAEIMDQLAPLGPVYQAGTLSGNPITMAAGIACLEQISQPNFYDHLDKKTKKLTQGIQDAANKFHIPVRVVSRGGMFGLFFSPDTITCYPDTEKLNAQHFKHFFQYLINHGVHWPPSPFESLFISGQHSSEIIAESLSIIHDAFESLANHS